MPWSFSVEAGLLEAVSVLDTQRACGLVASSNKHAEQVNMRKAQGGWRPLSMLEESFKAVEGAVARQKLQVRAGLPPLGQYIPPRTLLVRFGGERRARSSTSTP